MRSTKLTILVPEPNPISKSPKSSRNSSPTILSRRNSKYANFAKMNPKNSPTKKSHHHKWSGKVGKYMDSNIGMDKFK